MMEPSEAVELVRTVFGMQIPEKDYVERDKLCPSVGSLSCKKCPVHERFRTKGLSCNEALFKYPDEVLAVLREYSKKGKE